MIKYLPFAKYDRLLRRLRKMIRRGSRTQRRDALAMVLGLHGLRATEVCRLRCGDLDELEEFLSVATLKGGKPRRISLGVGVYRELRKQTHNRRPDAPLLATSSGKAIRAGWLQRRARAVISALFGAGLRFHSLRHTYAMRLYHATRDMQRVKSRLGHRSLGSTQIYVDAYGELSDQQLETIGELEDLRAKFPGGEWFSAVKGLGREGAGEVENGVLDWLSKNRDAAVIDAARGAADVKAPAADDVERQIARFLRSVYEFAAVPTLAEVKGRLSGTMQAGPEWEGLGGYSLAGVKVGLHLQEWNGRAYPGERIIPYAALVRELHELAADDRAKALEQAAASLHEHADDKQRAGELVGKIQKQAREMRTGGGKGKRK